MSLSADPVQRRGLSERLALTLATSIWNIGKRAAPNAKPVNYMLAGLRFWDKLGRLPVSKMHPDYTINDFIFHRMIGNDWSAQQLRCIDKVSAKDEAVNLSPNVTIAPTRLIIDVSSIDTLATLFQLLRPFVSSDMFAKPAHATKGVVHLLQVSEPEHLEGLYRVARDSYFWKWRETQYASTPRRIVIEDAVRSSDGALPDDYKFHCAHGEPVLLQVNHGSDRRLFDVADFAPFDTADGRGFPDGWRMANRIRLDEMTYIVRALAAPFDYVRIDLYDGQHGVTFGEFTFTPGAGVAIAPGATSFDCHRHRRYSDHMLAALGALPKSRDALLSTPHEADGDRSADGPVHPIS